MAAQVATDGFDAAQLAHPPGNVEGIREELRNPRTRGVDFDGDELFIIRPGIRSLGSDLPGSDLRMDSHGDAHGRHACTCCWSPTRLARW